MNQQQQDAYDEMPQRRGGGTIISFTDATPETSAAEVRTRRVRFPRREAAARRLRMIAFELEEERDEH